MRLALVASHDLPAGRVAAAGTRWIVGRVGEPTVYEGLVEPRVLARLPAPLGLGVGIAPSGRLAFADVACADLEAGTQRRLELGDLRVFDAGTDASFAALAWAPDGEEIVVCASRAASLGRGAPSVHGWRLAVLDGRSGERRAILAEGDYDTPAVVAADDDLVAAGDFTPRLWRRATGEALDGPEPGPVRVVAVTLAAGRLAAADAGGDVAIASTTQPAEALRWPAHAGVCAGVAIDPEGRWLASTGHDARVRVWSLDGGLAAEHELPGRGDSVAVADGGRALLVAWSAPGAQGVVVLDVRA